MNYIDVIIGLLLLFAAISGFRKGLISEIISLAALILGIWGAINYSYITIDFIKEFFGSSYKHLNIVSFIITFIVIVIVINLAGNLVNKILEIVIPGFLNKIAGLAFGILRTALILSIILIAFDKIDNNIHILSPQKKAESQLYPSVRNLAPSLFPFIDNWDNADKNSGKEVLTRIKKSFNM
ncbi:MAG: CvpA family protein [Prolixibacteraceae bacterium]|jgi:membrane protein required for colicin V production|nr:CvpA family protein [Prolixibacteraceae bacterium]NLO03353.1 CvpA family protein [Bacteroidales bacterium]